MAPRYYGYKCDECNWSAERYGNIKKCPQCGASVYRSDNKVLCYHGTTADKSNTILKDGFKPDCWFAVHMEDAIFFGEVIFAVEFERKLIPKGWQFHVLDTIPMSRVKKIYCVSEVD